MTDPKNEKGKSLKLNIGDSQIELPMDNDGNITMPDELRQIIAAGMSVLSQSAEQNAGLVGDGGKPQGSEGESKVTDAFRGLPMSELIGAPMYAAAQAQQRLAAIAWEYYQKIAFDDNKKTRILEFDVERPVIEEGTDPKILNQKVKAPFIGLVPIPSLLIDRINVDFQMEVTDTNVNKSNSTAEASTNISAKWFCTSVNIAGKVATSRENTRTTNQTAKYQVNVTASQQPPTEGLSKLMDIMASCIEPITNDAGGNP